MSDSAAIYVHIPFCVQKCSYCDFYSDTDFSLIPDYIEAVTKEIQTRQDSDRKIETLYFGGGTPSVLAARQIEQILQAIKKKFNLSLTPEITLEVNPGTIDSAKLKDYRSLGINRLSVGVQSFNDEKLVFLNRIHTVRQALDTLEHAGKAGFDNIGLDLIYGLPFESEHLWQKELNHAVKIAPAHLSCYMLTIEPATPLWDKIKKGQIDPIRPEIQSDMFRQTSLFLTGNGYEHYEISNFAKGVTNRSKHNCGYWQMKPYLGFGAAAHSFDGKKRSWNHSDIKHYIYDIQSGRLPIDDTEELTRSQQMTEAILLGLRTLDGIDIPEFEQAFDVSFRTMFTTVIHSVCDNRLGGFQQERFALNLDGRMRLNNIVEAFVDLIA
ncbi:MAG: radical SAM family heme chaperone HemW [Pseudomonadota bacterium]